MSIRSASSWHWSAVHSTLFATFVPLAVYARNRSEVAVSEIWYVLAILLATTAVIQSAIWFRRLDPARSNLLVSAFWIAFYLFMPALDQLHASGLRIRYSLLTLLTAAFVLWVILKRSPRNWIIRGSEAVTVTAVVLTLPPLGLALTDSWRAIRERTMTVAPF